VVIHPQKVFRSPFKPQTALEEVLNYEAGVKVVSLNPSSRHSQTSLLGRGLARPDMTTTSGLYLLDDDDAGPSQIANNLK
jgi:hypothetical protein